MKNKIVKIVLAIISYLCILKSTNAINNHVSSNIFNMLLLVPILLLFLHKNDLDNRDKKYASILAIFSGLVFGLSESINLIIYTNGATFFTRSIVLKCLFYIIGFSAFFYYLFALILPKIKSFKNPEKLEKNYKKFFVISFLIISICYLPYFLHYYPAVLSVDSYYQIAQIEEHAFSNWHPFLHTKFIGLFYNLGKALFGTSNAGIALYAIIQMLISSFIFATITTFIYKKNISKYWAYAVLVFFAVSPLFATYSVTIWKDVIFGLCVALQFMYLLKLIDKPKSKTYILKFALFSLLTTLSRNNGIFCLIILTPFLLIYFIKNKTITKELILSLIAVFIIYFGITGPLYKKLNVTSSPITESLSIPLNQMARVWYKNGKLSQKEEKYLNSIMDTSMINESYSQILADPIKNLTNSSKIADDKLSFIKNWSTIMFKNLDIYIDSFMIQTSGYWNVNLYDVPIADIQSYEPISIPYKIEHHNLLPNFTNSFFDATHEFKIPFLQLFYNAGLMFYLLIVSFIITLYNKKQKYWIAYIPLIAVWTTIMIATPIYASARYVYALFTCLPMYLSIPLFRKK